MIAVDTVLGSVPPAARTGDLATKTGESLGETVVFAAGCASPGDGGGGIFGWDVSASTGDDGGTISAPRGAARGRWIRMYSGSIDVKWFGAGLGASNDQPMIQAAINACAAAGGGTVMFPSATYVIAQPIY